jgi:hypothetical protein
LARKAITVSSQALLRIRYVIVVPWCIYGAWQIFLASAGTAMPGVENIVQTGLRSCNASGAETSCIDRAISHVGHIGLGPNLDQDEGTITQATKPGRRLREGFPINKETNASGSSHHVFLSSGRNRFVTMRSKMKRQPASIQIRASPCNLSHLQQRERVADSPHSKIWIWTCSDALPYPLLWVIRWTTYFKYRKWPLIHGGKSI